MPSPAQGSKLINGYSHFSIHWISQWNEELRERIVMDSSKKQQNIDIPYSPTNIIHQIKYYVTHNDWENVVRSISEYPFQNSGKVDQNGK